MALMRIHVTLFGIPSFEKVRTCGSIPFDITGKQKHEQLNNRCAKYSYRMGAPSCEAYTMKKVCVKK